MAKTVWKLMAIKNSGKLVKGMNAEILVVNSNAKPNLKQIAEAFGEKYGVTISTCHCGASNFEIEKL